MVNFIFPFNFEKFEKQLKIENASHIEELIVLMFTERRDQYEQRLKLFINVGE